MHIGFLCDEYPPGPHGGIGSFTQTMGRSLVARGHSVTSVGVYKIPKLQIDYDNGVRIVRIPHAQVPWSGAVVHGFRLRKMLRQLHAETPFDVLEGPELSLWMIPRHYPWAKVIRLNGGHHFFSATLGKAPRPWRSWMERRSFAHADHLCAVSKFVIDVTRPMLHLEGRPVEILPNPIDTNLFQPTTTPVEPGLITFVGTLCDKKGVRELVLAMPQVLKAVPHARLRLIGRDSRDPVSGGSYTDMLRGLLPAAQMSRIEFTGHIGRAELPSYLALSDVMTFPSHMESQGIVIVEAMACGKAVVTTGTGPGPEIVEHGISGLLCDPHDPASIAEQLIAALTDRELNARLGRAARERAVNVFSEQALMSRTETFYERCRRRA